MILNFIHQELHQATERKVPVLHEGDDNENLEVYHRTTYQDAQLDVCVYWPRVATDGDKRCLAILKFTSDNLPEDLTDDHLAVGVVHANAGWNAEAKADEFTFKNQKLGRNYWAPRWKVC